MVVMFNETNKNFRDLKMALYPKSVAIYIKKYICAIDVEFYLSH